MSKIRLHGSSSGYTEIAPVAASGNNTLTLPNDGTIISKDSAGAIGVTSVHTTKITNTGQTVISNDIISADDDFFVYSYKGGSNGQVRSGIQFDSSNQRMEFYTATNERLRIESDGGLKFNSGYGSLATAFGVRAWVSFNGTGTPAIRGDGGVSSVGDNDTGDYTVNFDNNMPDVNYAVGGLSENWEGNNNDSYTFPAGYTSGATVGSYRLKTIRARFDQHPPQFYDPPFVQLIFVR